MVVRVRFCCALLLLGLAIMGGCSRPNAPLAVELKLVPEHPRMVAPITFTVHVADVKGRPIDNAQVSGSLSMKTMDMGKNELSFQPKGDGNYEASRKEMDMSGPWDLNLEVSQGSPRTVKTFEIVIYE